jgi:hypothetical protein
MHPDFQLPSIGKISGRSSSITAAFFTAITPVVKPSEAEVEQALDILGMTKGRCVCVYCGGERSEWDHFRPIVENQLPTGFITEIANLVPACGKCNQSKGGKGWREWMYSKAKKSPLTRGVPSLDEKANRLSVFEKWREPVRLDYEAIFGSELWQTYLGKRESALRMLVEAQGFATDLRTRVEAHMREYSLVSRES